MDDGIKCLIIWQLTCSYITWPLSAKNENKWGENWFAAAYNYPSQSTNYSTALCLPKPKTLMESPAAVASVPDKDHAGAFAARFWIVVQNFKGEVKKWICRSRDIAAAWKCCFTWTMWNCACAECQVMQRALMHLPPSRRIRSYEQWIYLV